VVMCRSVSKLHVSKEVSDLLQNGIVSVSRYSRENRDSPERSNIFDAVVDLSKCRLKVELATLPMEGTLMEILTLFVF
jgi:hypothetical protein